MILIIILQKKKWVCHVEFFSNKQYINTIINGVTAIMFLEYISPDPDSI